MVQPPRTLKDVHKVFPYHGAMGLSGQDPDLHIPLVGEQRSAGGYRCEQIPALLAVHTIWEGSGRVLVDDREYRMKEGDVFVFFPRHHIRHFDDPGCPWRYTWFILKGLRAAWALDRCGLTDSTPRRPNCITPELEALMKRILESYRDHTVTPIHSILYAWEFVGLLEIPSHQRGTKDNMLPLTESARTMMEAEYSPICAIGDVAEHLGVNRSTLFRQFRKTFDMAPKKYKDFVRLRKAAWLLANSNLLGKEVATACGYADVNYFCRAFKKLQGLSPQQYRQQSRAIPPLAGRNRNAP